MAEQRLAHRIFNEKRRFVVPLIVLLAINAVIYGVAVYPQRLRVAAAERRAAEATRAVELARQIQMDVRARVEGKGRADEQLTRFYQEVLPQDLSGARRITYLRLAQLADQANLRYERRTIRTERVDKSRLAKLNMTMVLEGAYRNVREFLYALETGPEFVVIESVALAQGEAEGAPLVLTIQVATFYLETGVGT